MSLTCRRGPRDLEGAGLAETGDVLLDVAGAAASGEAGCSAQAVSLLLSTLNASVVHTSLLFAVFCCLGKVMARAGSRRDVWEMVSAERAWQLQEAIAFTYRPTVSLLPP